MPARLFPRFLQVRSFLLPRRTRPRSCGPALYFTSPFYGQRKISSSSKDGSTGIPATPSDTYDIDMAEWMKEDYSDIKVTLGSGLGWRRNYVKPGAPWGFVVYRAVYGKDSDERWKRMVDLIRDSTAERLSPKYSKDGEILRKHFELTIIEDEKKLAGADSHTIRKAFREWVAEDLPLRIDDPEKHGGIENIKTVIRKHSICDRPRDYIHPYYSAPPRWNFCLSVDDICLRSLNRADAGFAVVKLVNANFPDVRCENIAEGWEDGETDDPEEDVGWMYTSACGHVGWYELLVDPHNWEQPWYLRPEKAEHPWTNDHWA